MKTDYTHITVILDRSGSMESIREDTMGGFNAFLKEQKAEPGTATFTLVQFDTVDPFEVVHRFKSLAEVPNLTDNVYVPRGGTPLLDSLGRGIKQLEADIVALKDEDRPSRVVVAVVTDGQENSSIEFKKPQIEAMINAKTEKDSWEFAFLSADLAAINDAPEMGFVMMKSLLFAKTGAGTKDAWRALSRGTSDYRASRRLEIGFDPEDRKHPDDPGKDKA